jgi:hypothetical protein
MRDLMVLMLRGDVFLDTACPEMSEPVAPSRCLGINEWHM